MKTGKKQAADYTGMFTATNDLLLRIHTATGWRLPKTESLCMILCRQLQKKLFYDYPGITHDQVETAFMKFGTEENFTGSMSIMIIDRVLKKFYAHQAQEKFDKERHQDTCTVIPLPTLTEHLQDCRVLIEHKYQLYLQEKLNVELLPPFIFRILCQDFDIDPDLPLQFVTAAKQFIAERKGQKLERAGSVNKALTSFESLDLESTCTKLAIECCFEEFKNVNMKNLYE